MLDPMGVLAGMALATGLIMVAAVAVVSAVGVRDARKHERLVQRVEPGEHPPHSLLARPQAWPAITLAIQHMTEDELDAIDRIADLPPYLQGPALHYARLQVHVLIEEARKEAYAAGAEHNCGCVDASADD